jgi:hypothetical protein
MHADSATEWLDNVPVFGTISLLKRRWQIADVAQLVEHTTENRGVNSPSLFVGTARLVVVSKMRVWLSGRASPCQGEGRGFKSRRPLEKDEGIYPSSFLFYGPVAQLGARLNRTEEVRGSNPLRSIIQTPVGFCFRRCFIIPIRHPRACNWRLIQKINGVAGTMISNSLMWMGGNNTMKASTPSMTSIEVTASWCR